MTMSDLPTTRVDLVDDELLLLDGRCSAKVQAEVDEAKLRQRLAATHQDVPPQLLYAASTILYVPQLVRVVGYSSTSVCPLPENSRKSSKETT